MTWILHLCFSLLPKIKGLIFTQHTNPQFKVRKVELPSSMCRASLMFNVTLLCEGVGSDRLQFVWSVILHGCQSAGNLILLYHYQKKSVLYVYSICIFLSFYLDTFDWLYFFWNFSKGVVFPYFYFCLPFCFCRDICIPPWVQCEYFFHLYCAVFHKEKVEDNDFLFVYHLTYNMFNFNFGFSSNHKLHHKTNTVSARWQARFIKLLGFISCVSNDQVKSED